VFAVYGLSLLQLRCASLNHNRALVLCASILS
jgi:hypothetical protein